MHGLNWSTRHGRASIDVEIFRSVASIRDLGGHANTVSIQPLNRGGRVVVQSRGLGKAKRLGEDFSEFLP